MSSFSIAQSFRRAWDDLRANSGIVFPAALALAVLQLLQQFMQGFFAPGPALYAASGLVMALEVVLGTGALVMVLFIARGAPAALRQLLPRGRLLLRVFLCDCTVLLMIIGIALAALGAGALGYFVLAGIAALRYALVALALFAAVAALLWLCATFYFVQYVAVDAARADPAPLDILGVIGRSAALVRGRRWRVLLLLLVMLLMNALGGILVVGIILSIPLSMLGSAHAYRQLLGEESVEAGAEK